MKRVALIVSSLLAGACASAAPPHPPTGEMWGYLVAGMLGYAPDRPSCDFARTMAQTRSGVPAPSQRSVSCQVLTVRPYRDGADSVYWVFGVQNDAEQFAVGSNDRALCTTWRDAAVKALRSADTLSECEPVVVRPEG